MAAEDLITSTGTTVTHDETALLQNSSVTPGVPGDANDDDVAVSTLPSAFSTRLLTLGFDPDDAIGAAESGKSNGNITDNVIQITGTGITDLAFTDANGDPLDGDSSGLFTTGGVTDGEEVFLFTDEVNNNIVLGKTAGGDIVFAIYLEETGTPLSGAKMWTVQYESLDHDDPDNPDDPDRLDLTDKVFVTANQSINFGFAGAPSGSNLFMTFGNPNSTQIVVIGKDPLNQSEGGLINTKDVLNISQAGSTTSFGVNGNQINPDEGAFITYVTGANTNFLVPNLDQNEADVEANIDFDDVVSSTGASFTVNQTNPGVGPISVTITALNTAAETGTDFVDGLTGDDQVDIATVEVVDFVKKQGQVTFTPAIIDNGDGTFTITGLSTGDEVKWTTDEPHNRVLIENVSNADGMTGNDNNTFDIGGFAIDQAAQDTDEVGSQVLFEDDGPVASGETASATVQEDDLSIAAGDLSDGIDEAGDPPTDVATGSVAALVTAGADEPATFSLSADTTSLPSLTSKGDAVSYSVSGDTLTASAGGRTVFTLVLATNGDYTFDLNDQLDHANGSGDLATLAIDLSSVLVATDDDGDSVTPPAETFVINVENDVPAASGETESATVQEDDLSIAAGDLSDGIDEAGDPPTDVATGSVAALVTAGADEPATFSLSADTESLPQTLTSKGDAVTYSVSGDTLTASAGGREVFTLVLAANGDYTFDLNDQLDHANGSGDLATLAIDLSSVLVATDFDGDSVTPPDETFVINVENDVPAASGETESATVQEDDLSIAAGDLSDGIDEAGDPPTDVATGSVAALVTAGADEPATFSLSADTESLPQTLTSKGDAVTYSVSGDTLTASAGGREVFTLVLAANGDYTFDLNDQLDHANGSGDLATLAIDLSSVLVATDFDGDSVTPPDETFVINVENDVPAASGETESATVQEDDLSIAAGDLSDGIDEAGDPPTDVATGSVAALVTAGADEPATFSLSADTESLPQTLTSKGDAVTYSVSGDTLTASAGGREVFTLVLAANGDYTFDLNDQLDHANGSGDLATLAIDLSSVLVATDFDGDSVTPPDETFVINVENDVPAASGETESATVQEDDLSIAAGDLSDGIDEAGDPPTDVATGSVAALVTAGADEPATFSLSADTESLPQTLTSKGDAVTYSVSGDTLTASAGGREVFTLVLAANGDYTFDLNDQLDHANGSGDLATLAIDLSSVLVATDFDGDSVTPPDETFVINVENDVPAASGETESATVQEDDLSIAAGDLSDGIDEAGDPPTDVATGSVAALVTAGADEPATFSLSADTESLPQTLTSKGDAVTYSVSGDTLTASAGGRTVFTLVLAANGDYTFDLNDQLDHANGSGDLATLAIDLSSVLVATDFDGDSVTPPDETFVINVENDVPTIGDISDGLVDFVKGDSVTNPLNGVVGADEPATYSVTSSPATLTILDGTSSQLALLRDINELGTEVTYFKDVDNSGTRNAGDVDFFKLTLEDGNYTFDVLQDPPPAEVNFGFAGAPSGSNLFMTFGAPTGPQIVVIGEDPLNQSEGGLINTKDVLNISQAGSTTSFGVNGNQINPDEGAFITYVTGANTNFLVPNLDQNEADVEANIAFQNVFDATSASFTVNQTNPGVGPISVTITAYSTDAEPGAGFVDGLDDDEQVDIATVEVVDFVKKQGPVTFEPAVIDNGDGTFTITGLSTGDQVKWTTDDPHNRILIQNTSNTDADTTNNNNTFDIGGFSLAQAQPAPDEKLDFAVQIADADGDTATSEIFSIGIDGTGTNDDDHVDGVNPDGLLIV